jgi:phytoene desaturase
MAKVFEEEGGAIKLKSPVKKLMVESGKVRGVELESGKKDLADAVVINADFAYSMTNLLKPDEIRKWSPKNLEKKKFSCSGFLMYLGVDKIYDQPHHTIIFARDYRKNVEDIFNNKQLSEDISLYVRNSSINDDRVAPKGKSNVYVLVPIANNRSGIDWEKEAPRLRELVLDIIEKRTAMKDIRDHIVEEKIIAPTQWEKEYNVYKGAIFNLAHSLDQMLYFRPHNQFEELKNCYLVGGGTHPGSGLPTIYDSGRITAELITKKFP